jgi:hypothetical protein
VLSDGQKDVEVARFEAASDSLRPVHADLVAEQLTGSPRIELPATETPDDTSPSIGVRPQR